MIADHLLFNGPCQPEVEDFDKPVGANHHILRLNVSMHYACAMGGGQCFRDLEGDAQRFCQTQFPVCDPLPESFAVHKFGSNEMEILNSPDLVNGKDIGMIERRGGSSLSLEALNLIVVLGKPAGQDLDCDLAVEHQVMREVYLAHSTGAEQGLNIIVSDSTTD